MKKKMPPLIATYKIRRIICAAIALIRGQLFLFPSPNIALLRVYGKVTCRGSKSNIQFGKRVVFWGDAQLLCGWESPTDLICLGDGVRIEQGAYINAQGGSVTIGNQSFVGVGCVIQGKGHIEIGSNTLFGPYVQIYSSDHLVEKSDLPRGSCGENALKVIVGDDCWIGASSIVLRGSKIESGSVIAAASVVRGNLEKCGLYGNPSRLVSMIREL